MMINGRLLLLVAVTALFVRVWSGNSNRHGQSVSMGRPALSQNLGPWHAIHPVPRTVISAHSVSATAHYAAGGEEVWTVTSAPIALPAGMAPGTYRVVDDAGRVARLEISGVHAGLAAGSHVVPADFHMTTIGARRWYFIRLQTPVVARIVVPTEPAAVVVPPVHEEARVERPAFTNPKFDFTGYCPAGSAVETVAEEFHPESPDLPVSR